MLNENGYYRPTYDEIVEAKENRARELFGDDIDTSELSVLGKFIRIDAYDLSKAYEDNEAIYYARFPHYARGGSLDKLLPFAGITRNPATYAQHKIKVTGEANFVIGMGELIVGTSSGVRFYNNNEYTISADGTVDVIVQCDNAGTVGNVRITEILEPVTEISGIEYISVESLGQEAESDIDLRKRFDFAIAGAGNSNVNAIKAALLRVPTITSANVVENDTPETDEEGRPPHTFECYVSGSNDEQTNLAVAEAIFAKKPVGIPTYSTAEGDDKVIVIVQDDGGHEHTIVFSRTSEVTIYLKVAYKKDTRFAENGEAEIQNKLSEYINGLGVGTSVILSKLYEYIYDVEGVTEVTNLEISTNNTTYTTGNVTIEKWQVATLLPDDVFVEVAQ